MQRGDSALAARAYFEAARDAALKGDVDAAARALARETVVARFERRKFERPALAVLSREPDAVALLTRTGFAREGLARAYLKIDGQWRDHLLFAHLGDGRINAAGL